MLPGAEETIGSQFTRNFTLLISVTLFGFNLSICDSYEIGSTLFILLIKRIESIRVVKILLCFIFIAFHLTSFIHFKCFIKF